MSSQVYPPNEKVRERSSSTDDVFSARALSRPMDPVFFAALFGVQLIAIGTEDDSIATSVNVVSAVLVTCFLLTTVAHIARSEPLTLWTPLLWFRVAGAAYIGFGSFVPNMVNYETLEAILSTNFFDPIQHLQVNMVYSLGMASTLLCSEFFLRLRTGSRNPVIQGTNFTDWAAQRKLRKIALTFLIVGGLLRYGVAVPVAFGLPTIVPGMFLTLAQIYYVGIVLLVMYSAHRAGKWTVLVLVLIGFDLFVSLLTFSKQQVLLLLLLSVLGYVSTKFSLRRFFVFTLAAILTFSFLQGFIEFGREELQRVSGHALRGTMSERVEVLQRFIGGDRYESTTPELQSALMRLSYVNADAFVIEEFDNNNPAQTYEHILAVFIPRVLWPDKPIITFVGVKLYYMLTSQRGSSFGTTIWAESYWNLGWLGVPFMSVPLAFVLSIMSRYSLAVLRRGQWMFFPVVVIGVNIGVRVDGYFVADIVGQAWMAFVLATFLHLLRWPSRQ